MSWTHIKTLIYIEDPLKRDFYLQMCQQERWSTRSLQQRLDSLLFERTALSRQPDQLIASELATLRDSRELSPALPPRELLQAKLHEAIALSRARLENRGEDA